MNQEVIPQSEKIFQQNFLMTTEGKQAGFIIDQSESMNTPVLISQIGAVITRYNLLEQFFGNRFDILQNFFAFSFRFLGDVQATVCNACSADSYDQMKYFG